MKRLWVYETMRVYCDRLVYPSDRSAFLDIIKEVCGDKLKINFKWLLKGLH